MEMSTVGIGMEVRSQCSKLIIPPNDPSAAHQPPSVTLFDGDATQKPRELSPTQLFQLDHVCFPSFPQTQLTSAFLSSASLFSLSCTLRIGSTCIFNP
jgi:hypothetical protein